MLKNKNLKTGFTLVELMVVVAIIGILSTIAVPNFLDMQMRSKRSELFSNVTGIRDAENAYRSEWGHFLYLQSNPPFRVANSQSAPFDAYYDNWPKIGYKIDGEIYGMYFVNDAYDYCLEDDDTVIWGATDLDDNSAFARVRACPSTEPDYFGPSHYY